ncbi:carbohydrate porin [Entomobacter blattae]|uniref:Porin B n=1 Tax=Entomobacter blattae TaxID=2762277 RepID=A0A7H1NQI2_9PROT|nr:carbohydrate porin [Entomobacter blattae]QNT78042.1 Porin B [Entomobacter blattae]
MEKKKTRVFSIKHGQSPAVKRWTPKCFYPLFSCVGGLCGVGLVATVFLCVSFKAVFAANPNSIDDDVDGQVLGERWDIRKLLESYGVTFGLFDVNEVWGNVSGGKHTGAAYDGITQGSLTVDTGKLLGIENGTFNISGILIRGRSISQDQLYVLNPTSGFEADRSLRLWEMWYQHTFPDEKVDIRLGQMGIDTEFNTTSTFNYFLNSSFGWPLAPSVNMYAGGPSWPLASLGVRLHYALDDTWSFLSAVVDDNPPGGPFYDPKDPTVQNYTSSGAAFHLGTGALIIEELQYQLNPQPDDLQHALTDPGLPSIFKLGGYYDTAHFFDQRYDSQRHLLALTGGEPFRHKGNWQVYALFDAMVWRPDWTKPESLSLSGRLTGNGGDRNIVNLAADAALLWQGALPGREQDEFGVGGGLGRISNRVRAYDRDVRHFLNPLYPIRSTEYHLEVMYNIQVAAWMNVTPDFQYVWSPGGGSFEVQKKKMVRNEAIFGLHCLVSY